MRTALAFLAAAFAASPALAADADWPYYNRTATGERHAPLDEVDASNVAGLEVRCTYDTRQEVSFQTAPIVVDGTMYATTEMDLFAIDPDTCEERWRVHEDVAPSQAAPAPRSAARRLILELHMGLIVAAADTLGPSGAPGSCARRLGSADILSARPTGRPQRNRLLGSGNTQ